MQGLPKCNISIMEYPFIGKKIVSARKETLMKKNLLKKHFVDRVKYIDMVKERINVLCHDETKTVFSTVLEWYGIPGIGKTEIGQYAVSSLCTEMKIPYVCIDFDPEANPSAEKYTENPVLLLKEITDQQPTLIPESDAFLNSLERYQPSAGSRLIEIEEKRIVQTFNAHAKRFLNDHPLVILFDSIEKTSPQTSDWAGKNIVSQLCQTGRCIIIWSGRTPNRWKVYEIRRRVHAVRLEALSPEATEEQTGFPLIYRFSFGHPLLNEKLSQFITRFDSVAPPQLKTRLVDEVDRVLENSILQNVPENLKDACRVLAIVRQFDAGSMKRILSRFLEEFKSLKSPLKVVQELMQYSLVEWHQVYKGYALDETLRRILALHLHITSPERYLEINRVADEIYKEWIDRVQENRSIYVLQRLYHQAVIAQFESVAESRVMEILSDLLSMYLDMYYRDVDTESDNSASNQLYEELDKDTELREIVGEFVFNRLKESISNYYKD